MHVSNLMISFVFDSQKIVWAGSKEACIDRGILISLCMATLKPCIVALYLMKSMF